ncbi:MAG: branched-chain amino acid ABC transporter permease, partial [Chloroflexota bacterium]
MVSNRAISSWLYRYVILPLGQMLIFILIAAVIMTVFAYILAILFPEPRPNIVLATQIGRQLPGMIISGVTIGFVYAMIALGYTLVYGVLKFINFAHSEIFMFGGVIGFEVLRRITDAGFVQSWSPVILVIVIIAASMLGSGLLAVVVERVAYRPLRGAPRLVPLISAIGISFFLQDLVRAYEAVARNAFQLTYPVSNIPALSTPITFTIGQVPVNLRITSLIVIVAAVLMLIVLNYFVNGTKLGRGIR